MVSTNIGGGGGGLPKLSLKKAIMEEREDTFYK